MHLLNVPTSTPSPEEVLEEAGAWASDVTGTLIRIGAILLGALILWLIGRLIIRSIVHGIKDGLDWSEDQAREVLTKVKKLSEAEEATLEERLNAERRVTRANTIGLVLRAGLNTIVIVTALIMILAELGLDVAPMLASAGIVGVALGFGAQSLVKDLLSGLFMLLEDQYGVGDVVDVGEAVGLVEEVGLRSTRLRALDGTVWYVPNGEIRRVGNMTQLYSQVFIEVRFAYDVDVDAARQAMLDAAEMAREDEEIGAAIIGEPEVAGIEALDYNAVMLRLLMQTKPIAQWSVMRAIREHMRDLFLERGIKLAAPEGSLIQSGTDLEPKQPTKARRTTPRAQPKRQTKPTPRTQTRTKPQSTSTRNKPKSS